MTELLPDLLHEFRRHKSLADRAMAAVSDADFFQRPTEDVNSIALIVKHLAGNLQSRWTDFLTTDGEKSTRNRDGEFAITPDDTRANLTAAWERGWQALLATVQNLSSADLANTVTIRGEQHTAEQSLLRGLTHIAYHTGQILYLVRLLKPDSPWLTIAPGQSRGHRAAYRTNPSGSTNP
jgi:uncharacterized damage-inducible protein DinB